MSQDEEQERRRRIVVETPTARREVVQSQTTRYAPERSGYSTGVVAAVALTAIAATAIIFLFLTNRSDDSSSTNINVRTAATQPTPVSQTPVIVQQPLPQQTPIIIQQAPPTTTAPAPVIIQQAPPPTTGAGTTAPPPTSSGTDDATLQTRIDKLFTDDREIAAAVVDAIVVNGKVTLTGTVDSQSLKQKAERMARGVKGVSSVENRITVAEAP
ncbi:MAG TPA: BON domain-containing protein [Pyrinomonadaceae bacterium]|jgi:hypothetical protein|nr:BON domain-containing protein [Pyrinomonadaceae bacterium]